MRQANARGEVMGLSEDELAFYDALETNDSAVQVLGDATLRAIAQELVQTVRANVTIDWTLRENVRAQLRVLVKRILRKHGYPPDKQDRRRTLCWSRQNTLCVLGVSVKRGVNSFLQHTYSCIANCIDHKAVTR
jgi:type I restriction enzyme R subunit